MIRRALILLAALVALYASSAGAYDVGDRTGPVIIHPGGTICDTAEDVVKAIKFFDGTGGRIPTNCGFLKVALPAHIEFVGHYESSDRTFTIIKILFLPPASLGIQYGWSLDHETDKGASA